jgi:hypothetical protein
MNATLTTFYLIQKIKQGFPYTIFPVKKNKCWKNFKIMRKSLFNYSLYSHPEIGNFRCDKNRPVTCLTVRFHVDGEIPVREKQQASILEVRGTHSTPKPVE